MANNEKNNNGTMSLGEISTIRNILMGDQMSNYDKQFSDIEAKIRQEGDTAAQALAEFKKAHQEQMAELEKNINTRLEAIEKNMAEHVAALQEKIAQTSQDDKHAIGQLLQNMGQQLLK